MFSEASRDLCTATLGWPPGSIKVDSLIESGVARLNTDCVSIPLFQFCLFLFTCFSNELPHSFGRLHRKVICEVSSMVHDRSSLTYPSFPFQNSLRSQYDTELGSHALDVGHDGPRGRGQYAASRPPPPPTGGDEPEHPEQSVVVVVCGRRVECGG